MEAELRKLRIDRGPTAIMPGSKGRATGHVSAGVIAPTRMVLGAGTLPRRRRVSCAGAPGTGHVENLEVKLDAVERGSRPQEIAKAKANFGFSKGGPYYELRSSRTRTLVSDRVLARQTLMTFSTGMTRS